MSTEAGTVLDDPAVVPEWVRFEDWMSSLENMDSPACEYNHEAHRMDGCAPCTNRVEYRAADCRLSLLVCPAAAAHIVYRVRNRKLVCKFCRRPVEACWRIIPT